MNVNDEKKFVYSEREKQLLGSLESLPGKKELNDLSEKEYRRILDQQPMNRVLSIVVLSILKTIVVIYAAAPIVLAVSAVILRYESILMISFCSFPIYVAVMAIATVAFGATLNKPLSLVEDHIKYKKAYNDPIMKNAFASREFKVICEAKEDYLRLINKLEDRVKSLNSNLALIRNRENIEKGLNDVNLAIKDISNRKFKTLHLVDKILKELLVRKQGLENKLDYVSVLGDGRAVEFKINKFTELLAQTKENYEAFYDK